MHPFHLAIPVDDLAAARHFYGQVLGCPEGRSSEHWIDFDMEGHQLVVHLRPDHPRPEKNPYTVSEVPIPHFGVCMDRPAWDALAKRLQDANARFLVEPVIRNPGEHSEQATLFVEDPAGNALEFKAMKDPAMLFQA